MRNSMQGRVIKVHQGGRREQRKKYHQKNIPDYTTIEQKALANTKPTFNKELCPCVHTQAKLKPYKSFPNS